MSKWPSKDLRFFPAAAETLGAVAARWPVAICSGALRSEIEYALRRLDRYDQVARSSRPRTPTSASPIPKATGWPWSRCRPTPAMDKAASAEPLQAQKSSSDLGAADCLVVEDSLAGIISAKGAGMRAVGVTNTYTALQLRQAGADEVVDGLASLTPEWIERRFAS